MRSASVKRGKLAQKRIRPDTSEKLRRLLADMGLTLREVARRVGKRDRWLEDAFARRDRNTGEILPLLERDTNDVLGLLRKLDWRSYRKCFHAFAEINAVVRSDAFHRSEYERANEPIPLLLMDNAVEQFADTLVRYLESRGVEAPKRRVIVDFFTRVPHPNAKHRFNFLELCAGWFEIKANERARTIRVDPQAFEQYDEYEPPIRTARIVAIYKNLRQAIPLEVRQYKRRELVRRRKERIRR
jgi:hypothetical protein